MTFRFLRAFLCIALLAAVVVGCSSTGGRKRGGYYEDDGPQAHPPGNLDAIPDADPRIEPLASGSNRPYVVFGKRYVPDTSGQPFKQHGIASWYGKKFHGNATSSGELYDMYAMTAAHPTLPIPSYARVTSAINGRTVIVRVNDRGPFHGNRIMDLSYVAAYKLGIVGPGSGEVTVQRILPDEIRQMIAQRASGTQAVAPPGAAVAPAPVSEASASAAAAFAASVSNTPASLPVAKSLQEGPRPLPLATPPAEPRMATLATAGASSVYLQLGAFSQAANAQALAARVSGQLRSMGLAPAIVARAGELYRVRVGPYADRNAALSAAPTVASRTGIQPTVASR